jgi:uncharacterized phiE125 gp8 family phage protein
MTYPCATYPSSPYAAVGGRCSWRVVDAATAEPLTVGELYSRARIVPGDEEDQTLVESYIKAAREQVERDTGCALPTQTIAIGYDRIEPGPYRLPMPPCQAVTNVIYMDANGGSTELDVDLAIAQLDIVSMPARLLFTPGAFNGLPAPVAIQPLGLVATVGWKPAELPELLKQAVGLLAAHYLTAGRDRTVIGTSVMVMPAGYEDAIAPFVQVAVI